MIKINKTFQKLKIALIADELTEPCLSYECKVVNVTPSNYKLIIKYWKPDLLLVESAWNGYKRKWRRKIISNPQSECKKLSEVVHYAQTHKVPTVFWNKEDGVHFNDFIDKALLFDHIFTTDSDMIPEYKKRLTNQSTTVNLLMFAVQPKIHNPYNPPPRINQFCFVGSYTKDRHPDRLHFQNLLFSSAQDFGLVIYDRNSYIPSDNYRLPSHIRATINSRIPHAKTGSIFKKYQGYINVNTVTDSPTMFSRRLIEIMACGSPIISSPARAINEHFTEFVHVVHNEGEAKNAFQKLSEPYSHNTKELLRNGAEFVLQHHTYSHRLQQILEVIK